jgi:histone H3/H4
MGEQEEEVGLPRAALNKLIKDTLPNVRVANETRDLVYACAMEYIRVVSSFSNQLCAEEQRKTISHEHVLRALEQLGFGPEYTQAANSVMSSCRLQQARKLQRQNSRLDKLGIPEEELLRQQQELFQQARHQQAVEEHAQMLQFHQMMAAAGYAAPPGGLGYPPSPHPTLPVDPSYSAAGYPQTSLQSSQLMTSDPAGALGSAGPSGTVVSGADDPEVGGASASVASTSAACVSPLGTISGGSLGFVHLAAGSREAGCEPDAGAFASHKADVSGEGLSERATVIQPGMGELLSTDELQRKKLPVETESEALLGGQAASGMLTMGASNNMAMSTSVKSEVTGGEGPSGTGRAQYGGGFMDDIDEDYDSL